MHCAPIAWGSYRRSSCRPDLSVRSACRVMRPAKSTVRSSPSRCGGSPIQPVAKIQQPAEIDVETAWRVPDSLSTAALLGENCGRWLNLPPRGTSHGPGQGQEPSDDWDGG